MKKITSFIFLFLFTLVLVACRNEGTNIEDLKSQVAIEFTNTENTRNNVTDDIHLPKKVKGFENIDINWTSDNSDVINIISLDEQFYLGEVNRTNIDYIVSIYAVFNWDGNEEKLQFNLTIVKEDEVIDLTPDFNNLIKIIYQDGDYNNSVTKDLKLPLLVEDITIYWVSSNPDVLSNTGEVLRQDDDITITLTANYEWEDISGSINFNVLVIKKDKVPFDFTQIFNQINLPEETTTNLTLPTNLDGVTLSWESDNTSALTSSGIVNRQTTDQIVTLTLTALFESKSESKEYEVIVLAISDAPESRETDISLVREMNIGANVKIHGVVTSLMTNGNFTIQDSTGAIPAYFGSGNNNALQIGREYILSGTVGEFNGLLQVNNAKIEEALNTRDFPNVDDISNQSLLFDNLMTYEAYIVSYKNLEVLRSATPNNAYELYLANASGEETMVRLDTRVNSSNPLSSISVGEIIDLRNVAVGQYGDSAQFLFNSRSSVTTRPKDPNQPVLHNVKNITYIIDSGTNLANEINITAGSVAQGENYYNDYLNYDLSNVNTNVQGNYTVNVTLSGISGYQPISTSFIVYVREEGSLGNFEGYYQSLSGLTGSDLNNELQRLIRNTGTSQGSTNQVKQVDNFNGKNYNIYTGYGGYGNREHVWPNSKLGSVKYDLHNLRAAVVSVNSTRSNYPFIRKPSGNNGNWQRVGSGFYPGDEHVGDVARIVLYISIRENLSLNSVGNLQMFIDWHLQDPVNEFEISRNNKIYSIQNNRNPFIDHPELVQQYFS